MLYQDQTNSRAVAAQIIAQWKKTGDFPGRQLDQIQRNRAFVTELVLGVVRWQRFLQWLCEAWVKQKPPPMVESFLWIGFYQLLFMDDVEEYAAVHETVEAVKELVGPKQANFVNALLRRAQREKKEILEKRSGLPLGIRQSHPDLLLNRWMERYGESSCEALCAWNNQRADVVLRICLDRIDKEKFLRKLTQSNISFSPHPFRPESFLILSRGHAVSGLPGYEEGWFTVQDPATVVAVELLDVHEGHTVLDACAAPGGKTILLAEQLKGLGVLVAADVYEDRLIQLRENIARMQKNFVQVVKADAIPTLGVKEFDRILLDVPCSNTGVIRRKPDIRWRFSMERMKKLTQTQRSILDNAAGWLRSGGKMVYSTCSLELEENEQQVERWIKDHPQFVLRDEKKLFPPETQTDGAYAALIEKL